MLRIRLLGPVGAGSAGDAGGGANEVALGGPNPRALLSVLALAAPRACSSEQIVDSLWGEDPPASARNGGRPGQRHRFFHEYNYIHRHSGIAWHTPASVHFGTADAIDQDRQNTLTAAYQAHPERFGRRPHPPVMPTQFWFNQPDLEPRMN